MKIQKASLILLIIFLSACSSTKLMGEIMSSWDGANIDEVVSQWGYPDEEREFQGRTLYVWHHNKTGFIPQTTTTTGQVYGNSIYAQSTSTGGYMVAGSCDRILEVDKNGNVVNWQWSGNNCPFAEAMEYSTWRKK